MHVTTARSRVLVHRSRMHLPSMNSRWQWHRLCLQAYDKYLNRFSRQAFHTDVVCRSKNSEKFDSQKIVTEEFPPHAIRFVLVLCLVDLSRISHTLSSNFSIIAHIGLRILKLCLIV